MRFLVFNLELNEGFETAYAIGQDTDEFDGICDHLIVEHAGTGKTVGTYVLQSSSNSAALAEMAKKVQTPAPWHANAPAKGLFSCYTGQK